MGSGAGHIIARQGTNTLRIFHKSHFYMKNISLSNLSFIVVKMFVLSSVLDFNAKSEQTSFYLTL